jgi:hypothetical protein
MSWLFFQLVFSIPEKHKAAEARRQELTFEQLAREYIANNVEG